MSDECHGLDDWIGNDRFEVFNTGSTTGAKYIAGSQDIEPIRIAPKAINFTFSAIGGWRFASAVKRDNRTRRHTKVIHT